MTTNNLTEQYKTGKLKNDFYYFDNGKTQYIVEYHNIKGVEGLDGVKVLERVPSYKQWQQMKAFCEEFNTLNVAEENQKLKELLLKCREKLDELNHGYEVWQGELTGFIEEIDEALK